VLLLGGVGIVWSLRHPNTQRLFLIWFFAGSLAIYSWASERFAWLVLHPLLPLILLAGIGVQALWSVRSTKLRVLAGVVIAACLAYTFVASFLVNARYGADPRDWLVSTQSSVDVKRVVQRVGDIERRVKARTGQDLTITVDSGQGATFPYAWYFRHDNVGYIDMTTPNYVPDTQVLIMTDQARAALLPTLSAYDGQRFRFRVWWVRDWTKKLDPGAWWTWFTERKPWNARGGMWEWIYVRKDAESA
jgi:predicted membrane-bound mannosyltransferase